MCTVTFIPRENGDFLLTSSRDVGYKRAPALPPAIYLEGGVELFYPKDGKAGGTWIGSSRGQRLLCLLNGGFVDHKQQASYRMSRGLIVTQLLAAEELKFGIEQIDLDQIEPFTLVIVDWSEDLKLFELVWDGSKKHFRPLPMAPRIWSSSTLYNPEMIEMRKFWFDQWLSNEGDDQDEIARFHREAGIGDPEVDVFLRRSYVGTVSITQVSLAGADLKMDYAPFPLQDELP